MADAMEVSLLSFISTCADQDWDLTDSQVASITSVVFGGQLVGSMFWGPLADYYGRKIVFISGAILPPLISDQSSGCAIITVAGFFSGFAPSFEWLIFLRGIVGFGVGGLIVPFDILAEFMPLSHRGRFSMLISFFWTIGSMFVASFAWILLSRGYSWRVLIYVTAVPVALSSIASILYLPESPRWLVVQGRRKEAEEVIQKACQVNKTPIGDFQLTDEALPDHQAPISELLKSGHLKVSVPLWIASMCFGFCYYGVILFVTVLSTKNSDDDDGGKDCSFDYMSIFISAASEIVGILITIQIIDRWGRVATEKCMFLCAGVGVALMGISMPFSAMVAVSLFARLAEVAVVSAVWVATPELFPTEHRITGHSVASCMIRIGAFCVPYLVESTRVSKFAIGIVLGSVNFLGFVATSFLPETASESPSIPLLPHPPPPRRSKAW
jgi:MFS family permease